MEALKHAIELTLPWPPSVNHYYRRVGHRTLISRQGRSYRTEVCTRLCGPRSALTCRLRVGVTLHSPTRRRFDIDNRMKALLDALECAGVYADDEQIDHLEIERGEIVKGGCVKVVITKAAP